MADQNAPILVVSLDEASPTLDLIEGTGTARALIWPGMGAEHRSMHVLELGPLSSTVPQTHSGEAVYYIRGGSGSAQDLGSSETLSLTEGSMVHVDPGTGYRFTAGEAGLVLLGGACPPDASIYQPSGTLTTQEER